MNVAPPQHYTIAALLLGISGGLLAFRQLHIEKPAANTPSAKEPSISSAPVAWSQKRRLAILGIVAFCVMIGEGAMADWSAVFLRDVVNASEGIAAAGYAAFSIAMALGRFSGDSLNSRLGPVMLVRCSGVLAVIGMALALLAPSSIVALIGFAAVGAGFATVVPQVFSAAGNTPGVHSGPAVAAVVSLGYLGFLLGPSAIGLLAELTNLRWALALILVTSFLLIVLAPSLRNQKDEKRSTGSENPLLAT